MTEIRKDNITLDMTLSNVCNPQDLYCTLIVREVNYFMSSKTHSQTRRYNRYICMNNTKPTTKPDIRLLDNKFIEKKSIHFVIRRFTIGLWDSFSSPTVKIIQGQKNCKETVYPFQIAPLYFTFTWISFKKVPFLILRGFLVAGTVSHLLASLQTKTTSKVLLCWRRHSDPQSPHKNRRWPLWRREGRRIKGLSNK